MKLGKTLYVTNRKDWRNWLRKHHESEPEIWLLYYKIDSGQPRIPYNDAVEEALCFGWIDSTVKSIDKNRFAQRYSPRRKTSILSEMNKERIRRLITDGKMTQAGLAAVAHVFDEEKEVGRLAPIPADILKALKADKQTWANWQAFPDSYRRIRVAWIHESRSRPEEFAKRLRYLLKMTKSNKRFGMVQ